jgi:mannose-6-phosphate isomerase class I
MKVLDFSPFRPEILKSSGKAPVKFKFPTPCREFALSQMTGRENGEALLHSGPSIVAVTQGRAVISTARGEETLALEQGESAFLSAGEGAFSFRGDYSLYAAGIGDPAPGSVKTGGAGS